MTSYNGKTTGKVLHLAMVHITVIILMVDIVVLMMIYHIVKEVVTLVTLDIQM